MLPHLTLQEEKDSGFDEVGIYALSASSLGHAVIFRVSMTEQSANKIENVLGLYSTKKKIKILVN